jgi:1-acyl-sn-glycerol-3-phosphate acyltransferase
MLMLILRLLNVGLHLLSGLLQCGLLFPWLDQAARNRRIGRWSCRLLTIFRIRLQVEGAVGAGAIVSNHISWIDVFVLDAIVPSRFLAKAEVRRWPAIGFLSARAGTLYVERGSRFGLRASNAALAECLTAGESIAFFPEGTSSPQGALLPFHANLFAGVIAAGAPVRPVALRYLAAAGQPSSVADYIDDMSLGQSMVRLLRDGPLIARVEFLPPLASRAAERRRLAAAAHASIAAALDQSAAAPDSLERKHS